MWTDRHYSYASTELAVTHEYVTKSPCEILLETLNRKDVIHFSINGTSCTKHQSLMNSFTQKRGISALNLPIHLYRTCIECLEHTARTSNLFHRRFNFTRIIDYKINKNETIL